jgi:glycine/D-amino acid oxidase-like deaminating enzyme
MAAIPDVLIVGGGVVGAATALELVQAGMSVTVLEPEFAGAGSTGAAMGHLVVMDDSEPQLALTRHSRDRWTALLKSFPAAAEVEHAGTLWLAASAEELEAVRIKAAAYVAHGIRAEALDAQQLAEAEPALHPDLAGAMRVPGDLVCYPPVVARELLARAERAGAVVLHGRRAVEVEAGAVRMLDGGQMQAGTIVVAAGAHSAALVPGLPVMPRRGHLVITDRQPVVVHHQLVEVGYLDTAHTLGGASVAFNVQPRRTGQLLVGSSRELVGFDRAINRPLLGRMLSRAVSFLPALARSPASRAWTGFRPATADALPLIGPWPRLQGVWIATGHEGLGITMATGTADLITAGLLGRTPPMDPQPFRPDRPMPEPESPHE